VSRSPFTATGKTASISVTDNKDNLRRSIRTNGKTDAAINIGDGARPGPDESTMILAAAIPLALKPDAALVANIGFGSGLTTHALLGSPNVREVDSIEIERMMIEGARLFHPRNRRAYEDPRSAIHIDDAKTFFASHGKRYDIIVSEPSNPWVSGVSTLFSHEFYGQMRRHLKDDGLLVQWVQSYDIGVDLLATVFKALGSRFGDYVVYRVGAVDLLIIATPGKALPAMRPDLFAFPGLSADLGYLGYQEIADLAMLRVGGRRALEGVFASSDFPPNSDYFPVLDQHAPLARFRGDSAQELRLAREGTVPVLAMLDGETRVPLSRVRRAGPNPPPQIARARVATEAIGVFLTGRGGRGALPAARRPGGRAPRREPPRGLRRGADSVGQCGLPGDRIGIPVLERSDVNIAFERIRASRCWASLGDLTRTRIELLQAINDRDGEAMRRTPRAPRIAGPELDRGRPVWLHRPRSPASRRGRLARAPARSGTRTCPQPHRGRARGLFPCGCCRRAPRPRSRTPSPACGRLLPPLHRLRLRGLIYESIWSHYLKLFLGARRLRADPRLAIFMGGMALGSWLVSRFTDRIPQPARWATPPPNSRSAWMALLFHRVFAAATAWSFETVLPALGGSGGVDLFKWTLASALILPASILLGTTFPLMSGGIIRAFPGSSGRALSMLYFTNSFGAAVGVLASGFFLIDRVGLPGGDPHRRILNVLLAIVVWGLAKRLDARDATAAPGAPGPRPPTGLRPRDPHARARHRRRVLHLRDHVDPHALAGLGASTHSFEVMLAPSSSACPRAPSGCANRLQAIGNHTSWLAATLLAKALFAVAAIWVYGEVLEFIPRMMLATARTDGGYTLTTLAGLLASMAVMFPTAFCAGMSLPLATHALTSRGHGEAAIGRVYGANTAGCILGTPSPPTSAWRRSA
jgi:predicted membrane-bound spermidine synthase